MVDTNRFMDTYRFIDLYIQVIRFMVFFINWASDKDRHFRSSYR